MSNQAPEPPARDERRVFLPSIETPTLTKAELSELLFDHLGLNKRESKDMVEAFFDILHGALASATSTSGAKRRGPGVIHAPANRSRSGRATWSHFTPATN
jgi:nucleoid DNA-binding protein